MVKNRPLIIIFFAKSGRQYQVAKAPTNIANEAEYMGLNGRQKSKIIKIMPAELRAQ